MEGPCSYFDLFSDWCANYRKVIYFAKKSTENEMNRMNYSSFIYVVGSESVSDPQTFSETKFSPVVVVTNPAELFLKVCLEIRKADHLRHFPPPPDLLLPCIIPF